MEWKAEKQIGSTATTQELLLLGVDGEVMEGKNCTVEKCLTGEEGTATLI
jgi:hypothetical protein